MATVSTDPLRAVVPVSAPSTAPNLQAQVGVDHILLHGIRWQTYEMLAADLEACRIRMTYFRGELEFMTLSYEHERYKMLLNPVVDVLADVLNIEYINGGSFTMMRADVECGLESDNCFYVANYRQVRGKRKLDLAIDPPPDLAFEVDVSRSSINRMSAYAALRIPEVWRFDGTTLLVYHLQANGQYEIASASLSFPNVSMGELQALIAHGMALGDREFKRSIRDWARRVLTVEPKPDDSAIRD